MSDDPRPRPTRRGGAALTAPGAAVAIALTLAVATGGCGGEGAGEKPAVATSAAALVPRSAQLLVTLDTRRSSEQVAEGEAFAADVPAAGGIVDGVAATLADGGIDVGALRRVAGRRLDVAILAGAGRPTVGFARPPNPRRFVRVLARRPNRLLHLTKDGWVVFARRRATLARVANTTSTLARSRAYREASDQLPDHALAKIYASGSGVQLVPALARAAKGVAAVSPRWTAAAVIARHDGFEVQVHSKPAPGTTAPVGPPYESTLVDDVASGSLLAVSFRNLASGLEGLRRSGLGAPTSLDRSLGISTGTLARALAGEGMLYVRPAARGATIPEVTLLAKPASPRRAATAVDAVMRHLAPPGTAPEPTTVDGAPVKRLELGAVDVYYGSVGDRFVVTDSAGEIARLHAGGGRSLADDRRFRDARDAVGLPEKTSGWVYLDARRALTLVEDLAELGGERVPAETQRDLTAVRNAILYLTRDGGIATLKTFVGTR